ncbi:uncharacterized protein [Euwallacea fornicatus]|uniref:uncharacterized protein isoform X2 n=1 Tax=Euwallacea fornicatus TaxID=995702 RepID=UPI00338F799C
MDFTNTLFFVQQSTLEKLKCSQCHNLLSVFPVYRNPKGDAICGRCPTDVTFTRDQLYEHAVELQKFPCINRRYGCLEALLPCHMSIHEEKCRYKLHLCPTRVYNNCHWEGKLEDLVNHFEKHHPAFILNDCRFEVDFVNNHSEQYLMSFAEELYIVIREAKSTDKTFSVQVKYLGFNLDVDNYNYELTLESPKKIYKFVLEEKVGFQLILQEKTVQEKLHNPTTIIASLAIKQNSKLPIQSQDEECIEDEYETENLKDVECPVCMYHLVPPIYQCETGHSICKDCKETQEDCPTCHASFNRTQNFTLERVIMNMIYPCKHFGCRFKTEARNIKKHEATCLFGPFTCPLQDFEQCSVQVPLSKLFEHIKSKHYENLLELDTLSIPFDLALVDDIEEGYILQYGLLLFKLSFVYKVEEKKFKWAVHFVGPADECVKYNFELEIVDCNEKIRRMYVKSSCTPLCDKNDAFRDTGEYVYLHYDQVTKFIKNHLTFRVLINKKE